MNVMDIWDVLGLIQSKVAHHRRQKARNYILQENIVGWQNT